ALPAWSWSVTAEAKTVARTAMPLAASSRRRFVMRIKIFPSESKQVSEHEHARFARASSGTIIARAAPRHQGITRLAAILASGGWSPPGPSLLLVLAHHWAGCPIYTYAERLTSSAPLVTRDDGGRGAAQRKWGARTASARWRNHE